jgi:hypothetical protein
MRPEIYSLFLGLIFLVSCDGPKSQNRNPAVDTKKSHTIKLTDSSRAKLQNALADIVKSNASSGDTTISGRYVNQGKYDNGNYYITIRTNETSVTLINLSLLKDDEISKLKKNGDNITVSYSQSDKTVRLLSADYETEK